MNPNPTSSSDSAETQPQAPQFNVREIYKTGWVRRTTLAGDKKSGPFGKRYDRLWAVFCVHDDVRPYLEFYSDPKQSAAHQPLWSASLAQCLHVSPSIIIQGEIFEFVVTLSTLALRLGTGTREQMNEWVETLKNRLRDIGVLDPKENFYSRTPEAKPQQQLQHLTTGSTTRDPNSPLPLPPLHSASAIAAVTSSPASTTSAETSAEAALPQVEASEPDDLYAATETGDALELASAAVTSIEDELDEPLEDHVTVISVNHEDLLDDAFDIDVATSDAAPALFATRVRIASAPSSLPATPMEDHSYEAIFTALPPPPPSPSTTTSSTTRTDTTSDPTGHDVLRPAAPTPSVWSRPPQQQQQQLRLHTGAEASAAPVESHDVISRTPSFHPTGGRRELLRRTVSVGPELPSPTSAGPMHPPRPLALIRPTTGSSAVAQRDRRRDVVTALLRSPILLPPPRPPPPPFGTPTGPLLPLAARLTGPAFRPALPPVSAALQHQPVASNPQGGASASEMGYSLKERQVARLRMEMQHPGGVRILLKKKDCLNTIALIDAIGWTWVGGWRQKEKPLLYNVFHIGDQILRVGHCNVSSAAEVNRLIKNENASQIEFIVRRVPFGRVFHLLRDSEGQSVGITTEGSTAEVRDVMAGGIAAQAGLPPMAVSPLSPAFSCTWTLTEINGRPLNLCSKEGEARDRLNAVGKAITVLVQPTDFVKILKKQLKSLRGYKDYLLG